MEKALLSVRNLHKEFDRNTILKSIDLDVNKGEVIVIIGPSGCGKSTLLRCLNGLEEIQGGEICLDGKRLQKNAKDISSMRQKIGMVFQSYDLFPHKTILENILLAPVKVQKRTRAEAEAEALKFLERSVWPIERMIIQGSYPADRNSGLPLYGRLSCIRRCCFWTKSQQRLILRWFMRCCRSCLILPKTEAPC